MNKSKRIPHVLPDGTIEIPLTKNCISIIDPVDADLTSQNWCCYNGSAGNKYAYRMEMVEGKHLNVFLHRVILERQIGRRLIKGELCDHIDGNRMNNRRGNLRVATHQQNMQNSQKRHNSTSPYKGIYRHKLSGKWAAHIRVPSAEQKSHWKHLGLFDTPEEAHAAYCEAALKYHREFARFE